MSTNLNNIMLSGEKSNDESGKEIPLSRLSMADGQKSDGEIITPLFVCALPEVPKGCFSRMRY